MMSTEYTKRGRNWLTAMMNSSKLKHVKACNC